MFDIKRNIDEILAIYQLEPEMQDIYVEGITDKLIIENFFEHANCEKKVYEIDNLDFSEIDSQIYGLDLRSNKNKLITFAYILSKENISNKIKCLIDRDFDGILNDLYVDSHLLYTDFSCMESYFLEISHMNKFFKIGIRTFPIQNISFILKTISEVLSIMFRLRLVNKYFNFNCALPKIEKHLNVDKNSGQCRITLSQYLDSYINTHKLKNKKEEILDFLKNIEYKCPSESKFNMNGHDFIEVLFHYTNKLKNPVNFKLENFERAFYLTCQPNYLEKYPLFKLLLN